MSYNSGNGTVIEVKYLINNTDAASVPNKTSTFHSYNRQITNSTTQPQRSSTINTNIELRISAVQDINNGLWYFIDILEDPLQWKLNYNLNLELIGLYLMSLWAYIPQNWTLSITCLLLRWKLSSL